MKVILVACFALLSAASAMPAVSQWTLQELSDAIQSPSTDPLVLPYLEEALNNMMLSIWHGVDQTVATVVLPAAVVEAITPVAPVPLPGPEPEAVVVPVVDATDAKSSPLVQIILNINGAAATAPPAAVATPVETPVVPTPVIVAPNPDVVAPTPVIVAPNPDVVAPTPVVVAPTPVVVAPTPVIVPTPVVVPTPVNPIDHVMIEPLPINPIDLISPVAPVSVIGAGTMIEQPAGILV